MVPNSADAVEFHPNTSTLVDQGMELQLRRFDSELAAGTRRIGWKIGITTGASRKPHGLTAPVIGRLDGARAFASGDAVPLAGTAKVRAEGEMALRVDRTLDAGTTLAEARAARNEKSARENGAFCTSHSFGLISAKLSASAEGTDAGLIQRSSNW